MKEKDKNTKDVKDEKKEKQEETRELETLLEEEKNRRLVVMADFENFKKRMEAERSTFGAIANMGLITEMLEIHDDLGLAVIDSELNIETARAAMINAQDKLRIAVSNAGIERIEVNIGDEFDKTTMEAIQAVPNDEMKGKVIAVISSAYRFVGKDNVIKPAKVIVGK